ncbi:MAG: acetyl-CoA decarbonylase/synthase complex subunit gamma [Anaerolineae bacterium]|mgnify:FL=1|jgi:acetyl-CoA decarbonylase/synthase complex subunit gamma|nr:acetyl-CoA decarbonylase/synthase complex subunit gamma [Anaerolineae bacterium]MBT4459686.1 acetyl-CoA decarbonylase/synthase complex subunit gamma [Anaerolineae bacterium]MBT4841544.1 acetyl-CoA decarbonylase/synthase complex subunit gamma [Anaerolineae bacterium]MBT6063025.1 acetyl-CoA decarbonylase/synthase complex subunit gamma [Anaerolineae bacterium]MBT6320755.1 acetyl-CoA decarbonylase/synthase complex subunit gamma [Anaerolineae bacterium]
MAALSGIQIYKMLPQTNCKDCDFPTCLAFAMKLAAKQVELSLCPHVSEESEAKLSEASAPPVRPFALKSNGYEAKAGNEIVLFRHEKTFYSRPGLFLRVYDSQSAEEIKAKITPADEYMVDYVGIELEMGGFVVQANGGDFAKAVSTVRGISHRPLILVGGVDELKAGLATLNGDEKVMLAHATAENWEAMATLAKEHDAALAIEADSVDEMVALSEKVQGAGVKDLVLSPTQRGFNGTLTANTTARRMAIKKNFRALGFPIINFPGDVGSASREATLAAQAIGKYSGFIVLDNFSPEVAYALLVLRENIYTDPQKPIQVTPGIYEVNDPGPDAPVLVTTNFSITYFSVANEVESSGSPSWLLVTDAEGMSVLTAWAAGKFDAEIIAKQVKQFNVADKVDSMKIVLPGHTAVLSGELEEELPDWKVMVGPREAVDLPAFLKTAV